jgi:hypothetical protein
MKIKSIKHIAISLLAGALLHGSSFAGPATWVHRTTPTALPLSRGVTVAFSGHPSKKPYVGATEIGSTRLFSAGQSASQPAASHQVNAGENSFSAGGDDWFRD